MAEGANQKTVDGDLKRLGDAGGEFASALNVGESKAGHDAGFERGREDAGGGDGILNGEVDADAADRRHGMGSIANA